MNVRDIFLRNWLQKAIKRRLPNCGRSTAWTDGRRGPDEQQQRERSVIRSERCA